MGFSNVYSLSDFSTTCDDNSHTLLTFAQYSALNSSQHLARYKSHFHPFPSFPELHRFFTGLLAFVVLGVAVAPKTKSSQIFGVAIGGWIVVHVPGHLLHL